LVTGDQRHDRQRVPKKTLGTEGLARDLFKHHPGNILPPHPKESKMLNWALTFLVVALIAAVLGFGGIAGTAAGIAKILFFVFIVLFLGAMVVRMLGGNPRF
jgi:uncharacterized membrane protein YtjA (UPF0391 family)